MPRRAGRPAAPSTSARIRVLPDVAGYGVGYHRLPNRFRMRSPLPTSPLLAWALLALALFGPSGASADAPAVGRLEGATQLSAPRSPDDWTAFTSSDASGPMRAALLLAERTRLERSRVGLGGPITALVLGTVYGTFGGVGLVLFPSAGAAAMLGTGVCFVAWGIPFITVRARKRRRVRSRIEEIDRELLQLSLAVASPLGGSHVAGIGATARLRW